MDIRKKEQYAQSNGRFRRQHFIGFYIATSLLFKMKLFNHWSVKSERSGALHSVNLDSFGAINMSSV